MTNKSNRKTRARRRPAPPPAFNGDHGPAAAIATAGTVIEELRNEDGSNPNRMARRRRPSAIEAMSLTMRQQQAAKAIENAWCKLQMTASGSELKAKVDSSPKPDAVVASQVDAQSLWAHVTKPIIRSERRIVEWVCCSNYQITLAHRVLGEARASERFKHAMDRVADHLRY